MALDSKHFFYELSDKVFASVRANEWCELYLSSESTDFVRINHSKVRQPGHVKQYFLTVRLGRGNKKISSTLTLSTHLQNDLSLILQSLQNLRSETDQIPDDPYLVKVQQNTQNEINATNSLPTHEMALDRLLTQAKNHDLVGLYTSGEMARGFASSFGQRNWFSNRSFQLDWSLFHEKDNALKSSFMGSTWNDSAFSQKWNDNLEQFEILKRPRKILSPGTYRIYLSPSAMEEIIRLLAWTAFSIQGVKNKTSPFLKLAANEEHFHPTISMTENLSLGISPNFNSHGEQKPALVSLVDHGNYSHSLVSSRSSRQYKIPGNGAEDHEQPTSLELSKGTLEHEKILQELGTGIYVNNLWYMNYSDRTTCRTTGMTRFATFWVENGKIQHPIQVLRFDESLFKAFGKNLEALTQDQELILSSDTYGERKAHCLQLPGALINDFNFCQ